MVMFHPKSLREVGFALFHLSFLNFIIGMCIKMVPFTYEDNDTYICSDRKLFDLKYVDDVMLLSKDPSKL